MQVVRLKEWRVIHNLTLDKAAEIFGLDPGMLSQLERGKRIPSLKTALEIETKTYGYVRCEDWINSN